METSPNMSAVSEDLVGTLPESTSKSRSFSDPPNTLGSLAPSPTFREKRGSKDDHAMPTTPKPLRRPDFLAKGLSLQMPSPAQFPSSQPLSPRLDQRNIYMQTNSLAASPVTTLPRHSRGLDFARASTTLHHSTVAERKSPGWSPSLGHRGIAIPQPKNGVGTMILDYSGGSGLGWGQQSQSQQERSTVSSSVGSINMMPSDSESSSSDDDASMGGEYVDDDAVYTTPQVRKLHNPSADTPFNAPQTPSGGNASWGTGLAFSPAQSSLMNTIRRNRLHRHGKKMRNRSSSASGSGYSSVASPRTTSPPPLKSIEPGSNSGYFSWNGTTRSRRQSLAMGTDGLHLSSGNDSGDELPGNATITPGVVRRAVTRRGNLLPKTKGFARIRAALAEEAAPVDTEVRREAETIRQVRERDNNVNEYDTNSEKQTTGSVTAASSPSLLPAVLESAQEDFGRDLDSDTPNLAKGLGMDFAAHVNRNSGGLGYWNRFDASMRTPPPPAFIRQGSSIMSDLTMDSPAGLGADFWRRPRARSSASDASEALAPNFSGIPAQPSNLLNDDMHLKKFKRRREDDSDFATIKRRAVSPGLSSQNSPVLTQSPSQRDSIIPWGQSSDKKKDSVSGGAMPAGNLPTSTKKLGLQGMVDTNDGLMKMSIE